LQLPVKQPGLHRTHRTPRPVRAPKHLKASPRESRVTTLGKELAMDKAHTSLIGQMNIMDRSGHKELTWDTDKLDEILVAQKTFDSFMKQGYSAFGSKNKADAKHLVREFDPTMEELVIVPKTVGG
jgi:hypothetical protein